MWKNLREKNRQKAWGRRRIMRFPFFTEWISGLLKKSKMIYPLRSKIPYLNKLQLRLLIGILRNPCQIKQFYTCT